MDDSTQLFLHIVHEGQTPPPDRDAATAFVNRLKAVLDEAGRSGIASYGDTFVSQLRTATNDITPADEWITKLESFVRQIGWSPNLDLVQQDISQEEAGTVVEQYNSAVWAPYFNQGGGTPQPPPVVDPPPAVGPARYRTTPAEDPADAATKFADGDRAAERAARDAAATAQARKAAPDKATRVAEVLDWLRENSHLRGGMTDEEWKAQAEQMFDRMQTEKRA